MAQPEEQQDWEVRVETCRVELWRGYVTSSFVARVVEGAGIGTVIDTSSSFRWRGSRAPDSEEAKLAHHELVSRLKSDGWSPGDAGSEWYETELARPVLVPPVEPDVAEEEAPPRAEPVVVTTLVERAPEPPQPSPEPPRSEPVVAPPPRPNRDRWRAVATVGLVIAIALLVFVATHY